MPKKCYDSTAEVVATPSGDLHLIETLLNVIGTDFVYAPIVANKPEEKPKIVLESIRIRFAPVGLFC
jgi:hypothetical protein